jgi:tight adherence protein C
VVFVIFAGNFLLCFLRSKNKFDDYLESIDKKEFGLKDFIPIGLEFNELELDKKCFPMILRDVIAKYKNKVSVKVTEIHGIQYSKFYMIVHNGYRAAAALLASAGFSLLGLIMAIQGDFSNAVLFSTVSIMSAIGIPFLVDNMLNEKIKKRRMEIQLEFPEFINKLTLLVNAGMTISKAWEKIITDSKKDTVLYKEMRYALAEIKAGKPEIVAYEEFARRCRIKEITKFVSVIIINLKRGGAEIVPTLKLQETESWEMRKAAAKQMGEEASTKILVPLMIMFVGIIIIVATPAVLSMSMGM